MRELFPERLGAVDIAAAYETDARPAPAGRPWLLVDMVTSIDGATTVGNRSGGLGSPGDREVFSALRGVADVVLAGAGTVRAERYGPPRTAADMQARRVARGQQPHPRIAVVSGRLDLDLASPLFTASSSRPIIFTTAAASSDQRSRAAEVAEVVVAGDRSVDLAGALAHLRAAGAKVVTCEGGPTLNGALLEAGLVDEWCLTVSPLLVGGSSNRAAFGLTGLRQPFRLERVLVEDSSLFLRYVKTPAT